MTRRLNPHHLREHPLNVLAAILILIATTVFAIDASGRTGRRLMPLGLALLSAGLLVAACWPQHLIVID